MRVPDVRFVSVVLLAAGIVPLAGSQSIGKMTVTKIGSPRVSVLGSGTQKTYNTVSLPGDLPDADVLSAKRDWMFNHAVLNAKLGSSDLAVPMPKPDDIRMGNPAVGFKGLTTVDTANTNGFVVSPPDQALCAGHGFVMEVINLSMEVYSTSGSKLTVPESVYDFIGADPNTDYLADPRCYYDQSTQRWFLSLTDPFTATNRSRLYLAVSQTSDPRGAYYIYTIDSTDDGLNGTPADPGCNAKDPCFGDQPTLGADAYGIYITTNEFGLYAPVFNGAEIYAISKSALEDGSAPTIVQFGGLPLAEGPAYSVQPASSPDLKEETASGVEYLLSALDFYGTLDNRIAVWAITNTSSLDTEKPNLILSNEVIHSETYGQPPNATQKAGPYPLGQYLGEPEELISSGDDRMQNVVYANHHLWGGLNTVVSDGTNLNAGIAYFDVKPSIKDGVVSGRVQGQSYISVKGNSVIYPGTAVKANGSAAVTFTLTGPSYYPSAAYSDINPSHAAGVEIVGVGVAPQDDFTGYPEFGGAGVARWGDYSYGTTDGNSLWLATEYIPGGISSLNYYTDFGTYVFELKF
jgi:hypothetical protein